MQPGVNGQQELTYRAVMEDGVAGQRDGREVGRSQGASAGDRHGGSTDVLSTLADSGTTRVPGRRQCLDDGHVDRQPNASW